RQTFICESAGRRKGGILERGNQDAGLLPLDIRRHLYALDLRWIRPGHIEWQYLRSGRDEVLVFFLKSAHPVPRPAAQRQAPRDIFARKLEPALHLPDNRVLNQVAMLADVLALAGCKPPG